MKENIIQAIVAEMQRDLDCRQMARLKAVLTSELHNVEIIEKSDCATQQTQENEHLLNSFISAKKIEGCSEKTLTYKSRKTKSDGREKRKAIFEAKTKCAQKSRLLPPSGQNTSVVQTPFESCLNDAFLLNFLLKYHLKTIANLAKNRIFT